MYSLPEELADLGFCTLRFGPGARQLDLKVQFDKVLGNGKELKEIQDMITRIETTIRENGFDVFTGKE